MVIQWTLGNCLWAPMNGYEQLRIYLYKQLLWGLKVQQFHCILLEASTVLIYRRGLNTRRYAMTQHLFINVINGHLQ